MIVGDALYNLLEKENVAPIGCFDNSCIQLSLGEEIIKMKDNSNGLILHYKKDIPNDIYVKESIKNTGLLLQPKQSILAMSNEIVSIPCNVFGLLQTKGSLARLMVSLHFSDGQLDPGFTGHVTFEMFNASDYPIKIDCGAFVGNLYLFETQGNVLPYNGKYKNSNIPTISK